MKVTAKMINVNVASWIFMEKLTNEKFLERFVEIATAIRKVSVGMIFYGSVIRTRKLWFSNKRASGESTLAERRFHDIVEQRPRPISQFPGVRSSLRAENSFRFTSPPKICLRTTRENQFLISYVSSSVRGDIYEIIKEQSCRTWAASENKSVRQIITYSLCISQQTFWIKSFSTSWKRSVYDLL